MQVGQANQKSTQLFNRALEMIDYLSRELDSIAKDMMDAGSTGDILIGQLVKRSKFSGKLVPYDTGSEDSWVS